MYKKNKRHALTTLLFILMLPTLLFLSASQVSASQAEIDALDKYCNENFSMSLPDGTDAEIVCRVGDPNGALAERGYNPTHWDVLNDDEKTVQRNKDHCAEIYAGNQDIIDSCRAQTDPHTGVPYVPIGSERVEADCKDGLTPDKCGIVKYLRLFINTLSAITGLVIVIMITVGGIQYSTARDNPQATAAAKQRITNAILALIVFLFTFAGLQWLVPGGIL